MCGIVGAIAVRNVPEILIEGLRRLEYRGYDSAGLAVMPTNGGNIERRRQVGKVQALVDETIAEPVSGTIGIAHTRWATHGVPSQTNAHPHMSNERIALVHNGIIENFEILRDELEGLGYLFLSETDSEVIVHLLDHYYQQSNDLLAALKTAIQRLEGAYSIAAIVADDPSRIVVARSGSPLVIGLSLIHI